MTARRATCSALAGLLACVLPAAIAGAQSEPTPFERLQEKLHAVPRPTRTVRRELVQEFLRREDGKSRQAMEARLLLGSYDLQEMDGAAAKRQFRRVAENAAGHPPEIRARALYGLHQAQRLEGEPDEARDTLRELVRAFPGTPFANCARTALGHLERGPAPGIGDQIPLLQMGRDANGRPIPSTRNQPRMFVFWSLEHEPSVRRLEELSQSWRRAGMPASSLIAFALEEDAAALREFARQREWEFTILPADQGFLQPDWLALGVHAVPSVLLIGRDDTLLARDVSADRLQVMLTEGG